MKLLYFLLCIYVTYSKNKGPINCLTANESLCLRFSSPSFPLFIIEGRAFLTDLWTGSENIQYSSSVASKQARVHQDFSLHALQKNFRLVSTIFHYLEDLSTRCIGVYYVGCTRLPLQHMGMIFSSPSLLSSSAQLISITLSFPTSLRSQFLLY